MSWDALKQITTLNWRTEWQQIADGTIGAQPAEVFTLVHALDAAYKAHDRAQFLALTQSPARESALVARIAAYLNALPRCRVKKTHGDLYTSGDGDLIGSLWGRFCVIEVKRPGATPSKLQLAELDAWRQTGAYAMWTDNFEAVRAFIQEAQPHAS